jgi:integrase
MKFFQDAHTLKPGLILFRRPDVKHNNWYCRMRIPTADRYKIISLKTTDINEATTRAFDHDSELRFKVKHQMPVFDKLFSQVAQEFSAFQKERAEAGEITLKRWYTMDNYISAQLNRYVGNSQITQLGEDIWKGYPIWRQKNRISRTARKKNKKSRIKLRPLPSAVNTGEESEEAKGPRVSDGTIRSEMAVFRSIMLYAAGKGYIRENQVFKARLNLDKPRREEFTPQEYRHLHTFARTWMKQAKNDYHTWYRVMTYNFMLVMSNTGMRTMEARNLRWRDIDTRTDKHDRKFVCINVRGKDKFRELVAPHSVATYLDRISAISKATQPDDFVFSTHKGKSALHLYKSLIEDLFTESGLLNSSSGSRRSTYCFRHTYATFRLMEGVDVYFLAKQMGTSVQMIEDYYGHITPAKNAERILQGIPGWEPQAEPAETGGRVNTEAPQAKAVKRRA